MSDGLPTPRTNTTIAREWAERYEVAWLSAAIAKQQALIKEHDPALDVLLGTLTEAQEAYDSAERDQEQRDNTLRRLHMAREMRSADLLLHTIDGEPVVACDVEVLDVGLSGANGVYTISPPPPTT